jgi:hypothetical protein
MGRASTEILDLVLLKLNRAEVAEIFNMGRKS